MALALSSVSFTACDDDDDPAYPNPQPIEDNNSSKPIKLGVETLKVKVGIENRQEVTVADGNGEYSAFASNTAVAKAYTEGGKVYVVWQTARPTWLSPTLPAAMPSCRCQSTPPT